MFREFGLGKGCGLGGLSRFGGESSLWREVGRGGEWLRGGGCLWERFRECSSLLSEKGRNVSF